MKKEILLLGTPSLYQVSPEVVREELPKMAEAARDLHDTLLDFRATYGVGRAIAAPQIGLQKRLIYMFIDRPTVFVNPVLSFPDDEMMEVMDDCMSFPNLLVKVWRHRRCVINYRDLDWQEREMRLEGDLAELLQHEYDHLDGILASMRAMDNKSFYLKGCKP